MKYFLSYLVALTVLANNLFVSSAMAGNYRIQSRMYAPMENIREFSKQNPKPMKLKDFVFKIERQMQTDSHLSLSRFINNKNAQLPVSLSVQDNLIYIKSGSKAAQVEITNDDRIFLNGMQLYREDGENSQVLFEKVQKILATSKFETKYSFSEILLQKLFPSAHAELGNNEMMMGLGAGVVVLALGLMWFFKKDDKTITKNSNLNINYKDNTPRRPHYPRYMANSPYAGTAQTEPYYDIDEEDYDPAAAVPATAAAQ